MQPYKSLSITLINQNIKNYSFLFKKIPSELVASVGVMTPVPISGPCSVCLQTNRHQRTKTQQRQSTECDGSTPPHPTEKPTARYTSNEAM